MLVKHSFGHSVSNNEVHVKYDIPPETRYIGLAFGSLRTCIRSIFEAQTIFGAYYVYITQDSSLNSKNENTCTLERRVPWFNLKITLAKFHKLYHIAQGGRPARLAQHVLFLLFLIFIQVNATWRPAASLSHCDSSLIPCWISSSSSNSVIQYVTAACWRC